MKACYTFSSARLVRLLIVALLALGVLTSCARMGGKPAATAVSGVLDLRDWDFRRDGPVQLNGQWAMYWKRLPNDLGNAAPVYLHVPGSWTGQVVDGVKLPAEGHATYRLRVLMRPGAAGVGANSLAVRNDSFGTAFELRVDGRRITGNGAVGTTAETSQPEYRGQVTILPPLPAESEWVLAVSNFHYRKGGPWNPLELGLASDLNQAEVEQSGLDLFLIGSLTIMGLYHLVLFALRRQDRSALYYCLFCIVITFRQASTSQRFLLDALESTPWPVLIRVEFVTFFLAIVFAALFFHVIFPAEVPRRLGQWVAAVGGVATVFTVAAPPRWSSYAINPYQLWTLVICAYLYWGTFMAARHRREGARLMLLGGGVLIAATAHDVLRNLEVIHFRYLVPFGFLVFTFAQAVMLSRRFVRATVMAETLTTSLEVKVEERTQELAAKNQQLEATITDLTTTRKQLQQVGLSVRIGADYQVFPYADVQYLTARDKKTVIHTRDREHEVARPLKEIEALLSEEVFQRVHRQCIVNVSCVVNMAHIGNGTYVATLRGRKDSALPVSRVHAPALKQRLGIAD